MSNFVGVQQVLQRISSIEQRFGVVSKNALPAITGAMERQNSISNQSLNPSSDFSSIYSSIKNNSLNQTQETSYDPGADNIIRMLHTAAQKYGVDPKLAQAVAKAESGYSPQAVSSTGAVGVMQLMPDTAAGLGVRNINDPRENIDGGVRYLKQMLDTFHGNVAQAVAAYNAGPQAVKD